jgi:hypothetical protein
VHRKYTKPRLADCNIYDYQYNGEYRILQSILEKQRGITSDLPLLLVTIGSCSLTVGVGGTAGLTTSLAAGSAENRFSGRGPFTADGPANRHQVKTM